MKEISYIKDFKQWEAEFRFSCRVKVRFSETDMYGHVNNTAPFVYFEYARIEYFKWLGFMEKWLGPSSEAIPVVADLQCDFLEQMFFDEEIDIYVKAHQVGKSSVDIHYMGKKLSGAVCLTGRGTMVQINKRTGRAKPWDEEMKNLLLHAEKMKP